MHKTLNLVCLLSSFICRTSLENFLIYLIRSSLICIQVPVSNVYVLVTPISLVFVIGYTYRVITITLAFR